MPGRRAELSGFPGRTLGAGQTMRSLNRTIHASSRRPCDLVDRRSGAAIVHRARAWRNGRRGRLKICCPRGRGSSSLPARTRKIDTLRLKSTSLGRHGWKTLFDTGSAAVWLHRDKAPVRPSGGGGKDQVLSGASSHIEARGMTLTPMSRTRDHTKRNPMSRFRARLSYPLMRSGICAV